MVGPGPIDRRREVGGVGSVHMCEIIARNVCMCLSGLTGKFKSGGRGMEELERVSTRQRCCPQQKSLCFQEPQLFLDDSSTDELRPTQVLGVKDQCPQVPPE